MASKGTNKYQVVLTKQAAKFLSTVPKNYYLIISRHLLALENDPFPHGSLKLQGSENEYRLRVGVYRILYITAQDKLIITIIKIGHRKDVYE